MKNAADSKTVVRKIVFESDELREVYYREIKTRRARRKEQREETDGEREERLQKLWQRLGYDPAAHNHAPRLSPAEAWMAEHPEEVNSVTAPTRGALQRLVAMEQLRFKATRARLRELGIR